MICYCIGVIKSAAGDMIGFKLLFMDAISPDIANIHTKVLNVTYKDMLTQIKSQPNFVRNLKVENGKIAGRGGALTRYGVIDSESFNVVSQAIVILAEAYSHDSRFLGYLCADSNGNLKELTEELLVSISNQAPVANGKIVTHNGKQKVAAIEGAYDVYRKAKPRVTRRRTVQKPVTTENHEVNTAGKSDTYGKTPTAEKNQDNMASPVTNNKLSNKGTDNSEKIENSGVNPVAYENQKICHIESDSPDTRAQNQSKSDTSESDHTYGAQKISHMGSGSSDSVAQIDTLNDTAAVEAKTVNRRKRTEDEMAEERINKARVIVIELMKFKRYHGSYAEKIVKTISEHKRCSLKQYMALRDMYIAWTNAKSELLPNKVLKVNPDIELDNYIDVDAEPKAKVKNQPESKVDNTNNTPVHKEGTKTPVETKSEPDKTKSEPEYEEVELPAVPVATKAAIAKALPVKTASEETEMGQFEYEIIDGKMYIIRFKEAAKDEEDEENQENASNVNIVRDIVIPQETIYDGKKYKITGIGYRAFYGSTIKTVKICSNIKDIAQGAFANCRALTAIDLSESSITLIPMSMCQGDTRLEAVNIGKNLERIHEKAFEGCISLKSVNAGSVETVAADAFANCVNLSIFNGRPKIIYDSAFRNCLQLRQFDFSETVSIGTGSFRGAGFEKLTIPPTLLRLGKKAFADCLRLSEVFISDGVLEVGDYCFAKSEGSCRGLLSDLRQIKLMPEFTAIKAINTPKSIEKMGVNPYSHVEVVYGYIGTLSESACLTYGITFVNIDTITKDNATKIRLKTSILGSGATLPQLVYKEYSGIAEGNVDEVKVDIKTDKLLKIVLKPEVMQFLNIQPTKEVKEPNAKFVGALNLVQDLVDVYATPLSNKLLSLKDAYYVTNQTVYDDDCNKIIKVKYTLKDSLVSGEYWMFIMDNKMVYCAELTKQTNIKMRPEISSSNTIALDRHLHTGDRIGYDSAFDGQGGYYEEETSTGRKKRIDVGELVQRTIDNLGVIIDVSNSTRFIYVPSATGAKQVLELVDYTQSLNERKKKEYTAKYKKTDDPLPIGSYSVKSILTYEELVERLKAESPKSDDIKFFNDLVKLSDSEVKQKLRDMQTIGVEMEAQLFRVSKAFNSLLEKAGVDEKGVDPAYMDEEVLRGLTQSYLMVEQDDKWMTKVQSKSLNKTHEYTIGKYTVTEMKSNQVVKFAGNPYMRGCKGAYVFEFTHKGTNYGTYASRYSLAEMASMLHKMTYIPSNINVNALKPLMTNANKLDTVDANLFYHFFPVLDHSDDWKISDRIGYLSWSERNLFYNFFVAFNISMYKPNGIFYLTMERYIKAGKENNYKKMVLPIVPIGYLDRALMIAETTNKNNSKSAFLDDMLALCVAEVFTENGRACPEKTIGNANVNGYYLARQLIINRDRTMDKYRGLVSDRVLYMLGVLHTGKLMREGEVEDPDFDDSDDIDFGDDYDLDDVIDVDDEDEDDDDIDFGDDDEDYDLADALEDDDDTSDEDADIEGMLTVDVDSTDLPEDQKEKLKQLQRILANMSADERRNYLKGGE